MGLIICSRQLSPRERFFITWVRTSTKGSTTTSIARIEEERYVWLDRFTIRNLELLSSANENAKTLSDILDETQTAMGGRMLKRWMILPLKNKSPIDRRLSVVSFLKEHQELSFELSQRLKKYRRFRTLDFKSGRGKGEPKRGRAP